MKYFFDTEFIEHATGIDLISIGIVREDGKTLYAETAEFRGNLADDWVNINVIDKLSHYTNKSDSLPYRTTIYDDGNVESYTTLLGIKNLILEFIGEDTNPIFYAYYASYDWVVFCKIFGRMIDLPKHFPMYCRDLKQMIDELAEDLSDIDIWNLTSTLDNKYKDYINISLKDKLNVVKSLATYPKQYNEHNALDDALWNYNLYKFIKRLKNGS